jgi:hypothetical protein
MVARTLRHLFMFELSCHKIKMVDVAAIYAQAGIEIANGVLMFEGVPFRYFAPIKARSNILNIPIVCDAIALTVSKITALGFEIVGSVGCSMDEIIINYTSQCINDWEATISIADDGVDITFSDRIIRIYDYDDYITSFPQHIRTAKITQELRAICIATIFAALPQPIAEEIAAEFSLY